MANAEIMWSLQQQTRGYGSTTDTHQNAADVPPTDRLRPLRQLSHDDEAGRVFKARRATLAFALAALALIVVGIVANARTSAVASANPYLEGPSILYSADGPEADQSIELLSTISAEAEGVTSRKEQQVTPEEANEPGRGAQQDHKMTKHYRLHTLSLRASQPEQQDRRRRMR